MQRAAGRSACPWQSARRAGRRRSSCRPSPTQGTRWPRHRMTTPPRTTRARIRTQTPPRMTTRARSRSRSRSRRRRTSTWCPRGGAGPGGGLLSSCGRHAPSDAHRLATPTPPHPTPPAHPPHPHLPSPSRSRGGGPGPARARFEFGGASGNARTQTDPHGTRAGRRPARVIATASAPPAVFSVPQAGYLADSDDRRATFRAIFSVSAWRGRARARGCEQVLDQQAADSRGHAAAGAKREDVKASFGTVLIGTSARCVCRARTHTHRFRIIAWDQSRSRPRGSARSRRDARRCRRWVRAPGRRPGGRG